MVITKEKIITFLANLQLGILVSALIIITMFFHAPYGVTLYGAIAGVLSAPLIAYGLTSIQLEMKAEEQRELAKKLENNASNGGKK